MNLPQPKNKKEINKYSSGNDNTTPGIIQGNKCLKFKH